MRIVRGRGKARGMNGGYKVGCCKCRGEENGGEEEASYGRAMSEGVWHEGFVGT